MNKDMEIIRKDFETIFDIPNYLDFDGEDYMYYGEDPLLVDQQQNISANWRGFKRGYNSNKSKR